MLLTAVVSSTMMAYAISKLCFESLAWYIPLFIVWFAFVYLFERIIISPKNIRKSAVLISRVIAAFAFAILHSIIMDTVFFKKDIDELIYRESQIEQNGMVENFDQRTATLRNSIAEVTSQIFEDNKSIERINLELALEANGNGGSRERGLGPIYENYQKNIAGPEIKRLESKIATDKNTLDRLNEELKNANHQLKTEIGEIPTQEDIGLLSYIKKMHIVVFKDGDFVSKLFYLLWLVIFIVIETLPLIGKLTIDTEFYYSLLEKDLQTQHTFQTSVLDKELQQRLNREILTSKNEELKYRIDENVKTLTFELSQNLAEIEALQHYLQTLMKKEAELQSDFERYFASHAEPLLEKLQVRYANIVNQLKTT